MAVDFGTKRIGVAVTDRAEKIALPLASLAVRSEADGVDKIARIAAEREVREIVLGLPLGRHGDDSRMSEVVRAFAEKLRAAVSVPVTFSDESYTTKLAEAPMMEAGMSAKKRRGRVDAGAATLLLRAVLDSRHSSDG
ncbi:Holliday junction resolvase RuvX [bacterium]|nr:Holliday junction resolvase RuvX [bacterium]